MSSAGLGQLCFIKTKVSAVVYQDIWEQFRLSSTDKLFGDRIVILLQDSHLQRDSFLLTVTGGR